VPFDPEPVREGRLGVVSCHVFAGAAAPDSSPLDGDIRSPTRSIGVLRV
jgi:hypothetical protein